MKQKIPVAAVVVILVVVGVVVVVFGWHAVTGGADADVTQETINRYQNMAKQNIKEGGGGGGAGSYGSGSNLMTHGAPPAKAPANDAGTPH